MKVRFNKGTFETCIFFALSPFLSIPLILFQLYKKSDKFMTLLLSLLMGMISFQYIPNWSDDKARYYERFELFKSYDYSDLLKYFATVKRPDFLYDNLIFTFSKLNLDINFLFFITTTFIVYSIYEFIRKIANIYLDRSFIFDISLCLMILFSFSQSGLFSGIRFYFATSVFIWGIYYFLFSEERWKGYLLLFLTLTIHFSFAFFIPPLLIIKFFPKKFDARIILAGSLVFIVLPKDYLSNILGFLEMPESYANKANSYLTLEREQSANAIILSFLRNSWIYFSYIFLLFINKERKSKIYLILIVCLSFVNITYSIPIVFNRYTVVLKILFLAFFIVFHKRKSIKSIYFYLLYLFFLMNFIVDVNVLRYNFIASLNFNGLLTIAHIFSKKVMPYEFLQ